MRCEQAPDEIGAMQAPQGSLDAMTVGAVVPEEVLPLGELLLGARGGEEMFACVRVDSGVVDFGSYSHGRRSKVLHLLKMEVEIAGLNGQLSHIEFRASGMRGNEVWYELLAKIMTGVDTVEHLLEAIEKIERRFAHHIEHSIFRMLGSHLKTTADMAGDKLLVVAAVDGIFLRIAGRMHRKVIAHAAAYKGFLHLREGIDGVVNRKQRGMVGVEIGTHLGMEAAGPHTPAAHIRAFASEGIHVGRRASEIGDIAFEVRHRGNGPNLAQN